MEATEDGGIGMSCRRRLLVAVSGIFIPKEDHTMSTSYKKVRTLLEKHGAILVRKTNHEIWRFPNRRIVALSKTPSDRHALNNQLRDIRRTAGFK